MQDQIISKSISRISPDISRLSWKEKVAICEEWKRSGLSKQLFCGQRGISEATFYGWCKRLWPKPSKSNLCPVSIIADPKSIPVKSEPITLEVIFPNAIIARVKATEGQFGFLLRELLDATSVIR